MGLNVGVEIAGVYRDNIIADLERQYRVQRGRGGRERKTIVVGREESEATRIYFQPAHGCSNSEIAALWLSTIDDVTRKRVASGNLSRDREKLHVTNIAFT